MMIFGSVSESEKATFQARKRNQQLNIFISIRVSPFFTFMQKKYLYFRLFRVIVTYLFDLWSR